MSEVETSRRNLLYGVAAAGVAVPIMAACGSDSGSTDAGSPSTGGGTTGSADEDAIKTSDIPVGGGAIFPDAKIVVTQPTAGDFKAFSAVCTHAGCLVSDVDDQQIQCNGCHFSKFSIEDGSVISGPAPRPLPEKTVKVDATGATLTVS